MQIDKKNKDSHKVKKNKKEKKHKNKKEKNNKNEYNFSDFLTYGLLTYPALLHELPNMFNAFDKGQSIETKNISDSNMREFLDTFLSLIEVLKNSNSSGWYKVISKDSMTTAKYVIDKMLKEKSIKQPSDLNDIQSQTSKFVSPKIFDMLGRFPDLLRDIDELLNAISQGTHIDVDEMDNEEVADELRKVFKSLRLDLNEEGYGLSKDETEKDESILAIRYFRNALKSIQKFSKDIVIEDMSMKGSIALESNSKGNESLSSSDGNSDSSDDSDDDEDDDTRDHIIGPSMPSKQLLIQAQELKQQYSNYETSENECEIGPTLESLKSSTAISSSHTVEPIGFVDFHDISQEQNDVPDVEEEKREFLKGREEWMLTPGERDIFTGMKHDTSRKFQTGKLAKKLADQISSMKESDEMLEEREKNQAIINEYNEKRGPSLMELHLTKSKKGKFDSQDEFVSASLAERASFDREKDILSHKKMTSKDVKKLVDNAKEIDIRFNRGNVQKSFM